MRGKFNLALFLIGLPPILGLTAFYLWSVLNQAPAAPKAAPVNMAAVNATLPMLQRDVASISSSLFNAIKKTNDDFPGLVAHNGDADLDNFVKSHPGLMGLSVLSMNGRVEKTFPSTVNLADASYGSSDEFQNILAHFKEQGPNTYKFYTQRLGYPAFVFTIPISSQSLAEAAFNLGSFFRDYDAKGGDFFILDGASGKYLYHSNPAKLSNSFNPGQEPWLTKVQTDLSHNQGGSSLNGGLSAAVYSPLGIGAFGIVHTLPLSALQPASPAKAAKAFPDDLVDLLQAPEGFNGLIALLVALGWVFIVGSLCYGMVLGPLRKAGAVVLNAAQGQGTLAPDTARRFGKNEVGQMVEAVALLTQKLEQEKQEMTQEKEEALRRGRSEVESKSKEAAAQVSAAQQQAQSARNELNEKNQVLNDKLKELDAMKAMQEGLRNQNEQAKAENAKLKGQISEIGQTQSDFQTKLAETQNQLKDMEAKMLQAVSAASAIQVSQVRAAAIRTMSEELKTTLGIIKGYVSSALGTAQGGINEKQQEFLGMVINRSARLEKFINDLLDIYQVEIEQVDAKKEDVNLASEIEGLAFNFQAQAEVKNIKMKVEAKGAVPNVPIVRRRFNQLWNILYLQIIKDAPRGSSIPIIVEPIGDNVKVTVQDPGLTVAPEHLPKLFDDFYDPKHPASPQLAGTGLKFALVKTILAAHGGGAVAEKADPGTKLLLTFATKAKKAAAPGPVVPAAPPVAAPSAGLPPRSPAIMPPGGIGSPKPAVPGIAPPLTPRPAAPGVPGAATSSAGLGAKPAAPAAAAAGAPPAGGGVLDALISGKVPPVSAPGLKPPPGPGMPPPPSGAPAVPGVKPAVPGITSPAVPAPGVPPAGPKPAASPGILDALLEKKAPAPGTPSPTVPNPPAGLGVKPPVPGVPSPAAPLSAPKPSVPGVPSSPGAPMPPPGLGAKPPMPGMPSVPPPVAAPGGPNPSSGPAGPSGPRVVPTNIKPTTPPPGILDLDNQDSFKVDGPKPPMPPAPGAVNPSIGLGAKPPIPAAPPPGAVKPTTPSAPVPGAPRPPVPGAPPPPGAAPRPVMPPGGLPPGLKPPSPGLPPGGLNPNAAKKEGDGELIE